MDYESLFEEIPQENSFDSNNIYLQDAEKALDLLFRIYGKALEADKNREKKILFLRDMLNNDLPEIVGKVPFSNKEMRENFLQLPALAANTVEHARLPFLRNKTIIGVGGQFSAGKSRFLNTFFDNEYLPCDQGPTTAIGTYIVKSSDSFIHAYSIHGRLEKISIDELKAISHDFSNTYKIGFSRILDKIIISTPNFSTQIPENIALLDTPGYNKPEDENSTIKGFTGIDERIAREHLMHCDFLIWLIAADSGCITDDDIEFLASLNLSNRCLIVYNRADLKSEEQIREILEETKKNMNAKGIPYYGITAFSSTEVKEYFGASLLKQFFEDAKKDSNKSADLQGKITKVKKYWQNVFRNQKSQHEEIQRKLQSTILASGEPSKIKSLLEVYLTVSHEARNGYYYFEDFTKNMENISKKLEEVSYDN